MPYQVSRRARALRATAFAFAAACALSACAPTGDLAGGQRGNLNLAFPAPPDAARYYFERAIYGSADVVPQTEQDKLREMLTGAARAGEGMNKPYAVAVRNGRMYVSDSTLSSVRMFDFPNGKYATIGEDDNGQLGQPLGLDLDGEGNLYVADARAKQIVVFDANGKYKRRIAGEKWFDRLASVTVDRAGTRLYAVDIGGVSSQSHRVRVFDAKSGEHLFDFGKRGTGPGELNLPRDVAIGKDGRLYVVDGGNFRIQVFDKDGKYLQTFGTVGRQLGNFARPKEIATDKEGNVYVVDSAFGNFQIFNADGELLMFVGSRAEDDGPARYMLPSGIAIDDDGRIYVVDQWFRKVDIYRPASLKPDEGAIARRPGAPQPGTGAAAAPASTSAPAPVAK